MTYGTRHEVVDGIVLLGRDAYRGWIPPAFGDDGEFMEQLATGGPGGHFLGDSLVHWLMIGLGWDSDAHPRRTVKLAFILFDDRDPRQDQGTERTPNENRVYVACLIPEDDPDDPYSWEVEEIVTESNQALLLAPKHVCLWLSHGYWFDDSTSRQDLLSSLLSIDHARASSPARRSRGAFIQVADHRVFPARDWLDEYRNQDSPQHVTLYTPPLDAVSRRSIRMDLSLVQPGAVFVNGMCFSGTNETYRASPHDSDGLNYVLGAIGFRNTLSYVHSVETQEGWRMQVYFAGRVLRDALRAELGAVERRVGIQDWLHGYEQLRQSQQSQQSQQSRQPQQSMHLIRWEYS